MTDEKETPTEPIDTANIMIADHIKIIEIDEDNNETVIVDTRG